MKGNMEGIVGWEKERVERWGGGVQDAFLVDRIG